MTHISHNKWFQLTEKLTGGWSPDLLSVGMLESLSQFVVVSRLEPPDGMAGTNDELDLGEVLGVVGHAVRTHEVLGTFDGILHAVSVVGGLPEGVAPGGDEMSGHVHVGVGETILLVIDEGLLRVKEVVLHEGRAGFGEADDGEVQKRTGKVRRIESDVRLVTITIGTSIGMLALELLVLVLETTKLRLVAAELDGRLG